MAPEKIHNADVQDEKIDVWAAGVVIFMLLAGKPPFSGLSGDQIKF